jgi:regulator of sigma E protease
MREMLSTKKDQDISVAFDRNGMTQSVQLHTDTAGLMGLYLLIDANQIYSTVTVKYNFFSSFPAGIMLGVNTLKGYVGDMKYVFTREGASSLGGFGAIGSLFPAAWDWRSFWMTTAFLSIILAFMNILPIPALDGGHVMFLLYEVITRRKPSDKFMEYAQITGMVLLFALLIYANGNDLVRYFFN